MLIHLPLHTHTKNPLAGCMLKYWPFTTDCAISYEKTQRKHPCLTYFKVAEVQNIGCRSSKSMLVHITSHLRAQRPTHLLKGVWRIPKAGNHFSQAFYLSPNPQVSHVPWRSSPVRDWSAPSTFHSAGSFRCRNAKATFSSKKSTSAAGGLDRSKNRVKFSACWLPAQVARNWAAS